MDPNPITYFAETDARNKKIKFGIKETDRLRHVYVVGKTGVGKSTLLENMAIQDIQNGNGIAFIDPHGSTAEKLLDYVPENRINDVLYFAPFDLEHPVSFNVLEDIGVDKRHLVVNGLMSTFEKIWEDAWSARMSYILINTLLALLEYPGATLLGVNRMLSDKEYRKKVVENIKDPTVKTFWVDEFGKYTDKYAAEATPAIQNKVGQFTSNPLVRNLVGQPKSSFDIRDFMDKKKILIINLSKGLVGEGNAKLIGSMLITKMYLAAMSRADKDKSELAKLPNFYLYVDEFQSFANKSFADILSEARKYKLGLNITHQYIEQMEEEVRDAVFGNVGTMITFRVGAFDAEVLEKEFAPTFTAEDLVNLGKYQIYLKLMIDEVSSHPFSAVTMNIIPKQEISFKQQVIENSWKQFTRPRGEVEEEIKNWHDEGTARDEKNKPNYQNNYGEVRKDLNNEIGNRSGRVEFTQNKPGTFREAQYSQKQYTPPQPLFVTPTPVTLKQTQTPQPEKPVNVVPDPNKIAFIKAAEDLKAKTEVFKETPHFSQKISSITEDKNRSTPFVNQKTTSLSFLRNDNNKQPSQENVSKLKDALSQVLKKTEPVKSEEVKKNPNPVNPANQTKPISIPVQDNKPTKEAQIEEKKENPKNEENKKSEFASQKKEEIKNIESNKEVPEDVLRKVLSMEDK